MKLSFEELNLFDRDGWIGPYSLLDKNEISNAVNAFLENKSRFFWPNLKKPENFKLHSERLLWFKSLHCYIPQFAKIVKKKKLINKVSSILGDDLLAWGVTVTVRRPQQAHRWHCDIEHYKWTGISVFIGLVNTTTETSLKVITGSHKFNIIPQEYGNLSDDEVLTLAQKIDQRSKLVTVPCLDGQFFIFNGRIWHGSKNLSENTRFAIIAQFATPGENIIIPNNYSEPNIWEHNVQAPCLLVKGKDLFKRNLIIKDN